MSAPAPFAVSVAVLMSFAGLIVGCAGAERGTTTAGGARSEAAGTLSGHPVDSVWEHRATALQHESLAERSEPQRLLDSAMRAVRVGRYPLAGRALRSAANVLYTRAAVAALTSHEQVLHAAHEIDYAATSIASWAPDRSRGDAVELVRRASASTNLAETIFHVDAASTALDRRDPAALSASLLMACDHLERALRDRGERPAPEATMILDDARALAAALSGPPAIIPDNAGVTVRKLLLLAAAVGAR